MSFVICQGIVIVMTMESLDSVPVHYKILIYMPLQPSLFYFQTIVLYPTPNIVTCTMRIWLREIGFALAYGALMLKTWRYGLKYSKIVNRERI